MQYLVFTQTESGRLEGDQLVRNAERYFDARLKVLASPPGQPALHVEIDLASGPPAFGFTIRSRAATADDRFRAKEAEARGKAGGMALLSDRCGFVWTIEPDVASGAGADRALLILCAVCASVALGPVLPPDGSTLFGVRGAIARAS